MKRYLLPGIILVALITGGLLWFRSQPEQQVARQTAQLFEMVAHEKISLRKPSDVVQGLTEVLAEEIQCYGEFPIPQTEITRDYFIEQVTNFQNMTSACRFTEKEKNVTISGSEAQVILDTEVHAAAGKNFQRTENWTFIIDLKKSDAWRIVGFKGEK